MDNNEVVIPKEVFQKECEVNQESEAFHSIAPALNHTVLLLRAETLKGEPISPHFFTRGRIRDLIIEKSRIEPFSIDLVSEYEVVVRFGEDVLTGDIAREMMKVDMWDELPVMFKVMILSEDKVQRILEVRKQTKVYADARTEALEIQQKFLRDQLDRVLEQEERLQQEVLDYTGKQEELCKLVEKIGIHLQKVESQPVSGVTGGFMTSSTQNFHSSLGNTTAQFQVKADLDLGKFSGADPVPANELTFEQWCSDVRAYQNDFPDTILLPAVRKSVIGKAKSVMRSLGTTYTVNDIVALLMREYEGVANSDVCFRDFYQLKQERNEKVQIYSVRLREAYKKLTTRFPKRFPLGDEDRILCDRFFYGMRPDLKNGVRHLYDSENCTFGTLLTLSRRVEDEETVTRVSAKGTVVDPVDQSSDDLRKQIEKVVKTVVKSNQFRGKRKGNSDNKSQKFNKKNPNDETKFEAGSMSMDIRQTTSGPGTSSAGPFAPHQRPIQCYRCHGWGHVARLCVSQLNYTRGGKVKAGPLPSPKSEVEGEDPTVPPQPTED